MKCSDAEQMIIDHVLGLQGHEQERELKRHLIECKDCRALSASYDLAVQALQTKETTLQSMLPPVRQAIAHAVATEERLSLHTRMTNVFIPILSAAAVLLAVLLSPVFFSDTSSGQLTRLEVLQAYADDLDFLEFGNSITTTSYEITYAELGLSTVDASHLLQQ